MATRSRRRAFLGDTPVALASIRTQRIEYELVVGRPWSDEMPAPADFGAPARIDNPNHDTAPETVYAFHVAYDEWKTTDGLVRWQAACDRWSARQDQFKYSRRNRTAKTVLGAASAPTPKGA